MTLLERFPGTSLWTEEKVASLRSLVGGSLTYTEIGALLGMSRNACIGKAKRLGLSKPAVTLSAEQRLASRYATKQRQNERDRQKRLQRTNKIVVTVAEVRPRFVAIDPEELRIADLESRGLTLMQLEAGDCRYPSGESPEITFCGHPKLDGYSYCGLHANLCWREPKERFGAKSKRGN